MKIQIIYEDEKSIEFLVDDVDISIFQILQHFLFKDETVKNAAFKQAHPILKNVSFWLEVSKGDPREILIKACNRAIEEINTLKGEILAVLEGEGRG